MFIAVPCVSENVFGEYEIDGAERPEVINGFWPDGPSSVGGSSSNQLNGLNSVTLEDKDSVMIEKVNSLDASS